MRRWGRGTAGSGDSLAVGALPVGAASAKAAAPAHGGGGSGRARPGAHRGHPRPAGWPTLPGRQRVHLRDRAHAARPLRPGGHPDHRRHVRGEAGHRRAQGRVRHRDGRSGLLGHQRGRLLHVVLRAQRPPRGSTSSSSISGAWRCPVGSPARRPRRPTTGRTRRPARPPRSGRSRRRPAASAPTARSRPAAPTCCPTSARRRRPRTSSRSASCSRTTGGGCTASRTAPSSPRPTPLPTRSTSAALVLDGTVDLTLDGPGFYVQQAQAFSDVLAATMAGCDADAACAADVGGGGIGVYDRLAARLARGPIPFEFPLADGTTVRRDFRLTDLETVAAGQVYSQGDRMLLQRAMAGAAHGDLVPLARLLYPDLGLDPQTEAVIPDPTYSDAIYYGVECQDYSYFSGTPGPAGRRLPAGRRRRRGQRAPPGLDLLRRPALPVLARRQHRPDPSGAARGEGVPTLVLGRDTDPATPYGNGVSVFGRLADGYLVTQLDGPHVIFGRGDPCPDDLVTAFLVEGRRPDRRRTTCPGPIADAYVAVAPASAAAFPNVRGRAGLGRDGDQLPARVLLLGRGRADGHGLPRRRDARPDRRRRHVRLRARRLRVLPRVRHDRPGSVRLGPGPLRAPRAGRRATRLRRRLRAHRQPDEGRRAAATADPSAPRRTRRLGRQGGRERSRPAGGSRGVAP